MTYCCCCFQFQFTPLHKAESRNYQSIVKLLLNHKARPTFQQPVRIFVCFDIVCSFKFFFIVCFGLCLIFRKVFFSLHRASQGAVTGACDILRDTRDGREKIICFFCCCNCYCSLVQRFSKSSITQYRKRGLTIQFIAL